MLTPFFKKFPASTWIPGIYDSFTKECYFGPHIVSFGDTQPLILYAFVEHTHNYIQAYL